MFGDQEEGDTRGLGLPRPRSARSPRDRQDAAHRLEPLARRPTAGPLGEPGDDDYLLFRPLLRREAGRSARTRSLRHATTARLCPALSSRQRLGDASSTREERRRGLGLIRAFVADRGNLPTREWRWQPHDRLPGDRHPRRSLRPPASRATSRARRSSTRIPSRPPDAGRAAGAEWIHVVDLDGARSGEPGQHRRDRPDCCACTSRVQIGGGVRVVDEHRAAASTSASTRVVLGTVVVEHPNSSTSWPRAWPGKVAVGLDARDGRLADRMAGSTQSSHTATDAARRLIAGMQYVHLHRHRP